MGFLGALFDLSFSEFVTTRLIRFLYALGLIVAALVAIVAIIVGFRLNAAVGVIVLILSPVVFLVVTIIARVYLELVIVVFRIAEYLRDMSRSESRSERSQATPGNFDTRTGERIR